MSNELKLFEVSYELPDIEVCISQPVMAYDVNDAVRLVQDAREEDVHISTITELSLKHGILAEKSVSECSHENTYYKIKRSESFSNYDETVNAELVVRCRDCQSVLYNVTNTPVRVYRKSDDTKIKDMNGNTVHVGDLMLNHMMSDIWEVCQENNRYVLKLLEIYDPDRYTTDLDGVGGFEVIGCVKE